MKGLTERQRRILDLVEDHVRRLGYPPTMQELADTLGVRSKYAIYKHLQALERKGYIRRSAGGARGITILKPDRLRQSPEAEAQVPLVGLVAAGLPLLAEENIQRFVPVPGHLLRSRGNYFALRVQGDSMIDAAILDGDLVIVRATSSANDGDIVVALIGDEATVKRLRSRNGQKYLQAENPDYPDIHPEQEWTIQGVVEALIRESVG
jgi:repressor LexA